MRLAVQLMSKSPPFVIVVVGLASEARVARVAEGVRVCCGHGRGMADALIAALTPQCTGILSFGFCGGLDPRLRSGVPLVASMVIGATQRFPTDERWSESLLMSHPHAAHVPILSLDQAVVDPSRKARLFLHTGASAVDMESHIAAAIAAQYDLPLAVLRVVADPAARQVPLSAIRGVRPDGRTDMMALVRALLHSPGEISGLVGVAREAWTARRTLTRTAKVFGHGFRVPVQGQCQVISDDR
jgi:hopanoid-associated phosphorylase